LLTALFHSRRLPGQVVRASLIPGALLLQALLLPLPSAAQGVRGDFRIDAAYTEYPTVERVSIPASEVPGEGVRRELEDGTIVECIDGECYYYRSAGTVGASPIIEDLRLTAWAGVQGLSGRVHLRGRFGSNDLWPRSSQEFEAIDAYVDYERSIWRARGGRQALRGGLGYYLFDGASLRARPLSWLRIEGFGGWSRGRTINQPRTGSLLAEVENAPPDKASLLWALEFAARPTRDLSATFLYLREVRTDGAALYSERLAFDAQWRHNRWLVDFSSDFDWAFLHFNEARLRGRYRVTPDVHVEGQYRHYRPFFELWTIWGVFSPVAYNEGQVAAWWDVRPGWKLSADGAYRKYDEAKNGSSFLLLTDDGYRARGGVHWSDGIWNASVYAGVDNGAGAYRGNIDFRGGYTFAGGHYLGVYTSGTQQINEYRIGDLRTRGGGVEARADLGRLRLDGSVAMYDHQYENRPGFDDYGQFRGRLALTYEIGSDPGIRRNRRPTTHHDSANAGTSAREGDASASADGAESTSATADAGAGDTGSAAGAGSAGAGSGS